jgi:hypothetical protein
LSLKEQEITDLQRDFLDLKQSLGGATNSKQTFIDPGLLVYISKLKHELEDSQKSLKLAKEDLDATKFTPNR